MKAYLKRVFLKTFQRSQPAQDQLKIKSLPSPYLGLELEVLEPRVLFSAAPVEPTEEPEPEQAEEAVTSDNSENAGGIPGLGQTNAPGITADDVQVIADAALQRWIDSGITEAQLSALNSVTYVIADLGDDRLASAEGTTITIDDDAAGTGTWFVDSTPLSDNEFDSTDFSTFLKATPGGFAFGKVDLLTTLLHEQGHILGLDEADGGNGSDVMAETLGRSQRRLPSDFQAIAATPNSLEGTHFLTFAETSKLTSDDPTLDDWFGYSVAIDGDTAVVGSPDADHTLLGIDRGAAYVFVRSGSTWSLQAKLEASDGGLDDEFGTSVAIEGDTIVVGASSDDLGSGLGTQVNAGSVYVFNRVGTTWTQDAKLTASTTAIDDEFGTSVSISSGTIAVGTPGDDGFGLSFDEGAVYIFTGSGGTWTQQARLSASDAGVNDEFGTAVDLDGDTLIVGSPLDDNGLALNTGSAYIFERTVGTWNQEAKIANPDDDLLLGGGRFGSSVAIDSGTVVIGTPGDDDLLLGLDAGSAYVYTGSGATWTQQAKLTADSSLGGLGDAFGTSVDIQGDTILVGAPLDDHTILADLSLGIDAGTVYAFTRSGVTWSQDQAFFPSEAGLGEMLGDNFGRAVALDGNDAIVGVPLDDIDVLIPLGLEVDAGSVYIFSVSSPTQVTIDGSGNLVITDINGAINNQYEISNDGTDLTLTDNSGNTISLSGVSGTGSGTSTVTIPLSEWTGGITVNSSGGSDQLTIDLGPGDFTDAITYNGGDPSSAPGDTLLITDSTGTRTFAEATFGFVNETEGTIAITGNGTITYAELESAVATVTSSINATDVTLNFSNADDTIAITNAGAGQTSADSNAAATTVFRTPSDTLEINAGGGTNSTTFEGTNAFTHLTLSTSAGASHSVADDPTNSLAVSGNASFNLGSGDLILGDQVGDVVNFGTLEINTTGNANVAENSATDLAGTNSIGGNLTLESAGDLTDSGTLSVGGNSVLSTLNGDLVLDNPANVLTGSVSATAGGVGDLTLSVATGLIINQLVAQGNTVQVTSAAGSIRDDGTSPDIDAASVVLTGNVAPGVDIGTLAIDGNLDLAGETVTFEIDGYAGAGVDPNGHDQIVVTGTVNLTGATLDTTGSDIVGTSLGDTFVIVDNDGTDAITGTFAGLAEGDNVTVNGQTFRIFYSAGDGNDVALVAVPGPVGTIYVDDSFTQNGGQAITDADLGTTGDQGAVMGVNAFATLAEAVANIASGGTIVINGGTYAETISLANNVTLEVTGPDAAQAVVIDDLATAASTALVLEGTSTLTVGDADDRILAGNISGSGNLVKQGAGTLQLDGINSYTGTTVVQSGTLQLDGAHSGGATFTIQSGATLSGDGSTTAEVSLVSGATFAPGEGGVGDVSTGNVTAVAGSSFTFEIDGTAGAGVDPNGHDQIVVTGTVNLTGATLDTTGSDIVGAAVGEVFVIIDNDGTDAVTGTFAGLAEGDDVTVNGQNFRIFYSAGDGNDVVLAAAPLPTSPVYVDDSFTQNGGQIVADADLGTAGSQGAVMGVNAFTTLSDAIAAVSPGGSIILNGGTYPEDLALASSVTLEVTGPDLAQTATISGDLSGAGGLVKQGEGTLVLGGSNSYTGTTTVEEGTLQVDGAHTGAGNYSVANGATLAGSGSTTAVVSLASGAVLSPGAGGAGQLSTGNLAGVAGTTFTFEIDGTAGAGVVPNGHDQVVVTGTVDLTGVTLDTTGSDIIGSAAGDVFVIIDNDGTEAVTGTFAGLAEGDDVTVNGQNFRIYYSAGDGNDVVLAAAPAVINTIYVDDSFNQNGGQLIADADLGTVANQSAVKDVNAFATLAEALAEVAPGGTVIVNGGSYAETIDLSNNITLEFTGPDVSQAVTIDDLSGAAGTNLIIEGGSTLTVGDADDRAFSGTISGSGNLVKTGSGNWQLDGVLSHTGTTVVQEGSLQLDGVHTGGDTYTIQNGATLIGTGSTNADVALVAGAIFSPGVNGVGDLGTGDLSAAAGATFVFEIDGTAGAGVAPNGHDQISVTGTVNLNGTTLDLTGSDIVGSGAGATFIIIDNDGTDAVTGIFNGVTEGSYVSIPSAGLPDQVFRVTYTGGDGNDVALIASGEVATTNISIDGDGNLIIDDVLNARDTDDNLVITRNGGNFIIEDVDGNTLGTLEDGATQTSLSRIVVPESMVTGGIIVRTLEGDDTVTVGDLGTLAGGLTIDLEDTADRFSDFDVINYDSDATLAANSNNSFQADTITTEAGSSLTTSGTGSVTWSAGQNIRLNPNSSINTDSGDIIFEANLDNTRTGNFAGIAMRASTVSSSDGNITFAGRGGTSGNYARGVLIEYDAGSGTASTVSAGNSVSITGTGGGNGLYGTGVQILGGTIESTGSGPVEITGSGGSGTLFNEGVSFQKGAIVDAGAGDLTIVGTGGATGTQNRGIRAGADSEFTSSGGTITLTGSGNGPANSTFGVGVELTKIEVSTTGSGNINIVGTGANGTTGNIGVVIAGGSQFSSEDGDLRISGTGRGTNVLGHGVKISAASTLNVSGNGDVVVEGTGAAGTILNYGVDIESGSALSVRDGNLQIEGTGLGTTQLSTGVVIKASTLESQGVGNVVVSGTGSTSTTLGLSPGIDLSGSSVRATGTGNLTTEGAGGAGTTKNSGIVIGTSSVLSTSSGNIDIDGTGGGTGLLGTGVSIGAGATITANSSGFLSISGTGANGTLMNHGIQVSSKAFLSTLDGDLSLDGTAGGNVSLNQGVTLTGATLQTSGSGNIIVRGTGSQDADSVFNVGISAASSSFLTNTGDLSFVGTGGTGSTHNNGIRIIGGSLRSTGGGHLTLAGSANELTTGLFNTGVYLQSLEIDSAGSIAITGNGGGGTMMNHGVYMGAISAPRSTPTVAGIAGAGDNSKDEDGNYFS